MPPQQTALEDIALATGRLEEIGGVIDARLVVIVHDGRPVPKARGRAQLNPRTGKQYVFTPKTTRLAERDLAWCFRAVIGTRVPFDDTVALVAAFFVASRVHGDLDNLSKLVMDAGNRARVWRDDKLVIAKFTSIELDAEYPRTVVAVAAKVGTLSRAPLLGRLE
jgi:Holliday junction resolvase RusA-like endonuclease